MLPTTISCATLCHTAESANTQEFLSKGSDQLLTYQLPHLVDAAQKRRIMLLKAGAVTSSILTLVSVQLMIFYTSLLTDSGLYQTQYHSSLALTILSYCSFFLNLTAISVSILLLSRLGNLPNDASRRDNEHLPQTGYLSRCSEQKILRLYTLDPAWRFLVYYWIICSSLGTACLPAQIMLYIWMVEALVVKVVITALVGIACLSTTFIFLLPKYTLI
ncbi:hypothetical protein L218DRAFT_219184 [Marasmius fiardii PR-910]|nr:hypothetical protein L218DRAFT_219184 [Marasmius fiardii PR-910]